MPTEREIVVRKSKCLGVAVGLATAGLVAPAAVAAPTAFAAPAAPADRPAAVASPARPGVAARATATSGAGSAWAPTRPTGRRSLSTGPGVVGGRALAAASPSAAPSPAVTPSLGIESYRLAGRDPYETAVAVSRETFPAGARPRTVVVAAGNAPADGLAAAPAATAADAPLLLTPGQGAVPAVVRAELARLRPARIVVAGGGVTLTQPVASALATAAGGASVVRAGGRDRYETAAALAILQPTTGGTVLLAGGMSATDALAAGATAGALGGRLLLVAPAGVPASTRAALARLAPRRIIVAGGPAAVNDAVLAQVRAVVPTAQVRRVAGPDRFATAVALSQATGLRSASAYVASGTSWTDAIAGGAAAGRAHAPLLLAQRDCVPNGTLDEVDRVGARSVYLLGGPTVLDYAVDYGIHC